MTIAPTKAILNFQDYLTYDDGTDNRYELVDGSSSRVAVPHRKVCS